MTVREALRGVYRLGMDSSAIIDYIEGDRRSIAALTRIVNSFEEGMIALVGSVVLRPEVLVYARSLARADLREPTFRQFLEAIERIPVTDVIAERAAEMRTTYRLETPDALHLATALESSCQALVTTDEHFLRAQGILIGPGGETLRIIHARRINA